MYDTKWLIVITINITTNTIDKISLRNSLVRKITNAKNKGAIINISYVNILHSFFIKNYLETPKTTLVYPTTLFLSSLTSALVL